MSTSPYQGDPLRRRIEAARQSADYRVEHIIDGVTETIVDQMLRLDLNRKELAELMGVSPARISDLLRGTNNFTVRTLVDIATALDCELRIDLVPGEASAGDRLACSSDTHSMIAAESRARYGTSKRNRKASRDAEIWQHLDSGKLKVVDDEVYLFHDRDGTYRPAKFRRSGKHSVMEKTNVGKRAFYKDRIIAVARAKSDDHGDI